MNIKEIAAEIAKSPVLLATFRRVAAELPPVFPPWLCPFWNCQSLNFSCTSAVLLKPTNSGQSALVEYPDGIVFYAETPQMALEAAQAWVRKRKLELYERSPLRYSVGELKLGEQLSEPPSGTWIMGERL